MSDEAGEVSDRRSDAHPSDAHPLILFDGVCNLCNATIQSIIERDGAGRFRFAPLQSRSADTEHESVTGSDQGDFPDSILLADSVGVHTRSSAAIRIARGLGFPYSLLRLATVVPRPLRDAVYSMIARHRYGWFGRRDTCVVPTSELAERFLDPEEVRRRIGAAEPALREAELSLS